VSTRHVNLQCKGTCDGNGPVYETPHGRLCCNDCFPKTGVAEPTETYDDHHIICPYCGHRHSDPDEYFTPTMEDTTIECSECDRGFAVTRMISVTYRAMPLRSA
jgi:hypothetical protein